MKKNLKMILGIVIGMVLVSGISVYATLSFTAGDIEYTKSGTNTKISVASALNELYQNKKETTNDVRNITSNGSIQLDKYYKNLNVNVNTTLTKTLLWNNVNVSQTFNSQDTPFTSAVSNYTHILVEWKYNTNSTEVYQDIFKIENMRLDEQNSGEYGFVGRSSNGQCSRRFYFKNSNNTYILHFGSCSENNNLLIPIRIYGLNFSY